MLAFRDGATTSQSLNLPPALMEFLEWHQRWRAVPRRPVRITTLAGEEAVFDMAVTDSVADLKGKIQTEYQLDSSVQWLACGLRRCVSGDLIANFGECSEPLAISLVKLHGFRLTVEAAPSPRADIFLGGSAFSESDEPALAGGVGTTLLTRELSPLAGDYVVELGSDADCYRQLRGEHALRLCQSSQQWQFFHATSGEVQLFGSAGVLADENLDPLAVTKWTRPSVWDAAEQSRRPPLQVRLSLARLR